MSLWIGKEMLGRAVDVVYLNFNKAFVVLSHDILIDKLH